MFRIGTSIKTESRLVVAVANMRREWEMTVLGHEISFWSHKNFPKLDTGDGCTTLNIPATTELCT